MDVVHMLGRALAARALFFGVFLMVWGLGYGQTGEGTTVGAGSRGSRLYLMVDSARRCQVMDNFGASDAWSCQFVGRWPGFKKNRMADWLFSVDTMKDGSPKGIGLTMWRFNIGVGTAAQGDGSGIRDVWRRTEAMVDSAGLGVAGTQEGQRWFVKAARERGVKQVLGFLNSPPVWLTKNGKGFASHGVSNIDPGRFGEFARWMVGVMASSGIGFDWVSPVNEPQWDWSDGGQEGCPYSNSEVAGLVRVLNGAMDSAGLTTKILLPEAGSIKYLFEDGDKPGRGRQIGEFFGVGSPNYVGGLSRVGGIVAAHSYFSTAPWERGIGWRKRVDSLLGGVGGVGSGWARGGSGGSRGLKYWQSEFCILGDDAGEIRGDHRDTGMTAALYMARVIHNDLVYANAAAWQWWLAISPYDYKDGLIYVDKMEKDGRFWDSKKLWALGNFSRFVRPGMTRIGVGGFDEGLLVSAYRDSRRRKLVVVLINLLGGGREISLERVGGSGWCSYVTSEEDNLRKNVVKGRKVTMPGRSICTLTANY